MAKPVLVRAAKLSRPSMKTLGIAALWVTCPLPMITCRVIVAAPRVAKKAQKFSQVSTRPHTIQPVYTALLHPLCGHSC